MKKPMRLLPYLFLAGVSLAGGTVNGVLGTGGGILIVYILSRYLKDENYTTKDIFANSMAIVLPISLVSLFTYDKAFISDGGYMLSVMIPAAVGGVGGALLSRKMKPSLLQKIFAVLVIYAGVKMIL